MLKKTQKPKTNVIENCEKLRKERVVERDNMRSLALDAVERSFLDNQIAEAQSNYGDSRIESMKSSNMTLRETCRRLKAEFYAARGSREQKMTTLTSEQILEQMRDQIAEMRQAIEGERKQQDVALSRIDRQLKLMREYELTPPPQPDAYNRSVGSPKRKKSDSM